jgi:hypothetical protein
VRPARAAAAWSTRPTAGATPPSVSGSPIGRAPRSTAAARALVAARGPGGSTGWPITGAIGVARTVLFPNAPIVSEIAPAILGTPSGPGQVTGEPEKPGPIPVASTAGPETVSRIRAAAGSEPPERTSSTRASKVAISVPRTTEAAVQAIPGRTSPSAIVGGPAARAALAGARSRSRRATARRSMRRGTVDDRAARARRAAP